MSPAASQLFRQQAYINGQWLDAPDGACQDIFNPATGELIGQVPNLGAEHARLAIEAANKAWPAWRAVPCTMLALDSSHVNQFTIYS